MRRYCIFFITLIVATSLSAQQMTTISGQLQNRIDQEISLTVLSFDQIRLKGYKDEGYNHGHQIKAVIKADSTFMIETEMVTHNYTLCKLKFGGKEIQLIMCPGDSLEMNFDFWLFDSNVKWSGTGADRNNYCGHSSKLFDERLKVIGGKYGQVRIDMRTEYRDDQLEFLNTQLGKGLVDSSFANWESRRIQYNYFNSLVRYSIWHNQRYSTLRNEPVEIFDKLDLDDEEALKTIPAYRSLIRTYLEFNVDPNNEDPKGKFKLLLELGQTEFSGLIRSYSLWATIEKALQGTLEHKEKALIWEYAVAHINDRVVKNMLASNNMMSGYKQKSFDDMFQWYFPVFMALVILAFLIYGFYRYRKSLHKQNRKINGMSFVKYGLILIFLIFSIYSLTDSDEISPWVSIWLLSMVVFIIVQTHWLVPRFAMTKKYFNYGVLLAMLITTYCFTSFLIVSGSPNAWFGNNPIDTSIIGCLISSPILVIYSFMYYYASFLSRRRRGFNYLLEVKKINLEFVAHFIIILVIYYNTVLKIDSVGDTRSLFYFFTGLMIFYLTAFPLTFNYLYTKKYWSFLLYTILLFAGVIFAITMFNGLSTYFRLQNRGIDVAFIKTLNFPFPSLLLLSIPGAIYSYARKIVLERENLGFSLFKKKEAELNQLRAQVNPHFLFNSLNTVYSFALKEGNDKTAESIAKLANLMRYLIDDMEQDEIPVKKEIGYINDYVKLQLIRSSVEHDISINVDLKEEDESKMIAPMLMIPFVENAFKHGVNPNASSELKLKVSFVDGKFQFVLENSIDKNFKAFYKEKGFGIGIENIRKRLEYIYPDKHTLSIADTEGRFIVIMEIHI